VNESTEVLITGAGPAGLLLACELRLAGVAVVVIERSPRRPDFCRGFNLNPRALDLLARRGLADALISEGWRVPQAAFSGLPVTLGLAAASTDHPYSLGIPQTRVEEVLEARARDLGADLRRGHRLVTLIRQDPESVTRPDSPADPRDRADPRTPANTPTQADALRHALTHWHGPTASSAA
jgi:2-polyprenyl-6-methoxyphenol hydroxylase-like FAD-dependent oxidoreductase